MYFDPSRPFIRWYDYKSWVDNRLATVLGGNIPPKLRGIFGDGDKNPLGFYYTKIHGVRKGVDSARLFYPMNRFGNYLPYGKYVLSEQIDCAEIQDAVQRVKEEVSPYFMERYPYVYALNFQEELDYYNAAFIRSVSDDLVEFSKSGNIHAGVAYTLL